MNDMPNQPEHPEADLAAAQARIRGLEEKLLEAEQELEAATDIINDQQVNIECQRIQLEEADLKIDEGEATRSKLEQRITDLEDELTDEPCPVPVGQQECRSAVLALKFQQVPPATLKATDADLAALEALVGKLGWVELMYRLGVIISRQAEEATGPQKEALEAAASLVNLWGPSFSWCNEEVCRGSMEMQSRRERRG